MINPQLNIRLDSVSSNLLQSLVKKTDSKQSEVIRKAIFHLAVKELGQEETQKIIFDSYLE